MVLVVGLGNPGRSYEGTRHNLGYEVVDLLARAAGTEFKPGRGEYWDAPCSLKSIDVVLLKPTTFMNDSGVAVQDALERYGIAVDQLLVVCDDFQLPLGTLRLRPRGSDGGHNGLASIIYHLQSDEFPRLRCGIGSPAMPADKELMADFVLTRFTPEELPAARTTAERARDACTVCITEGFGTAMNQFNVRPDQPTP
jgi:PTH1 family peptidyl-tRNA hydrolase